MIDIQKAKQEFKKYVSNYDIENERIKVKIAHTERTAKIAKEIAKYLKLEEEKVQLAELIGLLHDIGRFEQVKRYNTFIDKNSVNHGELGVEILFEKGLIQNFIVDRQYDEIIKKSILNHNRNKKDLVFSKEKEELYTKIIRDADKTDIIYALTFEEKEAAWGKADFSNEKMTDEIFKEFIEEKEIDYQQRKTAVDILVSHFAYVYDFNYPYGLQVIKEKNYIKKIYDRFKFEEEETKNRIKQIYEIVEDYLEKIEGENK